jgi:GNAT superfamily N-acetyltransferase
MTPVAYPAEQSVDIALRDGSTVHVRPVLDTDEDAIRAFLESMSLDSLYFRCCGIPNVKWLAKWSADVDYPDRYGVVATSGADGAVVAHAAYVRLGDDRAEIAFEVGDALQGHGIGTLLLVHLAAVAACNGISVFIAQVMPSNHKMIDVFRDSGFPVKQRTANGVTEIELLTSASAVFPQHLHRFP